ILAVLERHVEEPALAILKVFVEILVDSSLRKSECEVVGRELFCVPAEHVARKLIEENYCCQRRQGIGEKRFDRKLPFLSPELQESLLDAMIELGIVFP